MPTVRKQVGQFHDRAEYSGDMRYRFEFERRWGDGPALPWVLLNPATGDTDGKPRPTLRRCIDRTRTFGFHALVIVNLFAYRATRPADLLTADDPIGEGNDEVLHRVTASAPMTVAAWGAHGRLLGRGREVRSRLPRGSVCLGVTRTGEPRHPLYVALTTEPMALDPWKDDLLRFEVVENGG